MHRYSYVLDEDADYVVFEVNGEEVMRWMVPGSQIDED